MKALFHANIMGAILTLCSCVPINSHPDNAGNGITSHEAEELADDYLSRYTIDSPQTDEQKRRSLISHAKQGRLDRNPTTGKAEFR
jgi:hypothetical protein